MNLTHDQSTRYVMVQNDLEQHERYRPSKFLGTRSPTSG